MKKVILFLFLFYVKIASAQHIFYGVDFGHASYNFGKASYFNSGSLSFGLCAQYVFKDSLFGLEGDVFLYDASPLAGAYIGGATYVFAPYFFFDPAPDQTVSIRLKAGFLYSHIIDSYPDPADDIGPSFGLYAYFKINPTFNLGIDFSFCIGQKFYSLQERGSLGGPPNPTYSSQLTTYNFSIKILFR